MTTSMKVYAISTWLQKFGRDYPSCSYNDVYNKIAELVFSSKEVTNRSKRVTELTAISEEEAAIIAREANIAHLDWRRVQLTILCAFHNKGVPKLELIRRAVDSQIITKEGIRCSRCKQRKNLTEFSEFSRMCKPCKSLDNHLRRLKV